MRLPHWTDEELAQYEATTIGTSAAGVALAVTMRGRWRTYGVASISQANTSPNGKGYAHTRASIPIIMPLPARISTFSSPRPASHTAGRSSTEPFGQWCNEAGLPKRCVFHGLRKAGLHHGEPIRVGALMSLRHGAATRRSRKSRDTPKQPISAERREHRSSVPWTRTYSATSSVPRIN